jgi:hypothetical protein
MVVSPEGVTENTVEVPLIRHQSLYVTLAMEGRGSWVDDVINLEPWLVGLPIRAADLAADSESFFLRAFFSNLRLL